MVFSSLIFVFGFLPIGLSLYLLLPNRARNAALLLLSLFFYAWGEGRLVALLVASSLANWGFGELIRRRAPGSGPGPWVAIAVGMNIGLLGVLKYTTFALDQLNVLLSALGSDPVPTAEVHLPLGVSFFTFQAVSYVVDVQRGHARAQRNPLDVALYIALFPQLIAGPIVRYEDVADQIRSRVHDAEGLCYGMLRFSIGLAKKVLIANPMGEVADALLAAPEDGLSFVAAWTAAIAYTLQIYFDFSGYSDMAIGLGRMFGFRLRENFDYPYVARSVSEFWRRWHISLSAWFRDYLYIPLGGNRRGPARTYANLWIVFLLCGLWHGASWTFVAWGAYHGVLLVCERWGSLRIGWTPPRLLRHTYTLLAVICGWVIFRAESLGAAGDQLASMFGLGGVELTDAAVAAAVDHHVLWLLPLGVLSATPWARNALSSPRPRVALLAAATVLCLGLSSVELAAGTHNPFIYFRF